MNGSGDRVIARGHHPTKPKSGSAGTPGDRAIGKTKAFFSTVLAALREIFDESAYDRFLLRSNGIRNLTSYRDFMQEREAAMAKKPRCC